MTYEELAVSHFREWGAPRYPDPANMCGFAARNEEGGLAAICWFWLDGTRWWGGFALRPQPDPLAHRLVMERIEPKVIEGIEAVHAGGVDELWALPDGEVPGARRWMRKLGFEPAGGGEEWVKRWPFSYQ